jgi:hypothetical protein
MALLFEQGRYDHINRQDLTPRKTIGLVYFIPKEETGQCYCD